MYRLIAVDMDGTLLNEDKEISDRCQELIKRLRENGKKIVLATGRPFNGVLPYIKLLDLYDKDDYVVTYNGALVQSTNEKHILINKPLSLSSYRELYDVSKELGVNIHALTQGSVLTPKDNPYTGVESSINQIPIIEGPIEELDDSIDIVKVMFIDEPKKLNTIIPLIPDWVKDKYTIVRSAPIFLEFLDKSVNKGAGVEAVAKQLGIKQEEVISVGDAENDVAMIQYAGLGVAMANATNEAKAVADHITLTNEEDGVAEVIERFML